MDRLFGFCCDAGGVWRYRYLFRFRQKAEFSAGIFDGWPEHEARSSMFFLSGQVRFFLIALLTYSSDRLVIN